MAYPGEKDNVVVRMPSSNANHPGPSEDPQDDDETTYSIQRPCFELSR